MATMATMASMATIASILDMHKVISLDALPVDLDECGEPPRLGLKPLYDVIKVFDPHELREIEKPSFDQIHRESHIEMPIKSRRLVPIESIKEVYQIRMLHRRSRGAHVFRPDLHEVLMQLPNEIAGKPAWICTIVDKKTPPNETSWYGLTFVFKT